jgi:uncharacterized membrane protein HdeD (DUF308 family)
MTMNGPRPPRSELTLDPDRMTRAAIRGVKASFGASGVVALILGLLLLFVPGPTIEFAAVLLGIYFVIVGIMRLILGIFGRGHYAQHRVLGILFGVLLLIAGIILLRDSAAAAATLLLIVVIFTGIGWIIDGVMSIAESSQAPSRGWAIAYGVISLIAGIALLAIPGWSVVWMILFAAIALLVLGVAGIVRAFTFGRR